MRPSHLSLILLLFMFGILTGARKKPPRSCKGKNGKTYMVGKGYTQNCITYVCFKNGRMKGKGKKCPKISCKGKNGLLYKIGQGYSEECILYTCTKTGDMLEAQLPSCSISTTPTITTQSGIETTPSGTGSTKCITCAYEDRIYNLGATINIVDKCTRLTCIGGNLGLQWNIEIIGTPCCQFNGQLLKEGDQVKLYNGKIAKCCKGEMVSIINDSVVLKDGCLFGPKPNFQFYPLNSEIKKNCTYYKCQSGIDQELSDDLGQLVNYTWVPTKQDGTCCHNNEGMVPNGWVGNEENVNFSCANGNMTVDLISSETHFDDDSPLSKDDMDYNLDTYVSHCLSSPRKQQDLKADLQELLTATTPVCKDVLPIMINSCCKKLNMVATSKEWASTEFYSVTFQGEWTATGNEVQDHTEYRSDNSDKYCLHMNIQGRWVINNCGARYGGYVFSGDAPTCPDQAKGWKFISQYGNHDMVSDEGMGMECAEGERTKSIYYFSGGSCLMGRVSYGQNQTTDNMFESENECILACLSPCEQPLLENKPPSCNGSESRYYFDGKMCTKFRHNGCESNRNNFESKEMCEITCLSKFEDNLLTELVRNDPIRTKDQEEFCSSYEKQVPALKPLIFEFSSHVNVADISSINEAWQNIYQQLSITNGNAEISRILPAERFLNLFGLGKRFRRFLKWATVTTSDCVHITVRVRYRCMPMPFNGPSTSLFNSICNNLISQGLQRHFETTFNYGTQVKSINIIPIRTSIFNPFSKLYIISKSCYKGGRSGLNMFLHTPIFIKACTSTLGSTYATESLGKILAHELGHDVLWTVPSSYMGGWIRSWTHKGTSTFFTQNTKPGAPVYPTPPGPAGGLDLMMYYNGFGDHNMITNNNFLAEEEAQHLVEKALFKFLFHCGGRRCGPCLFGGMCQAGLKCRWFRCVECTNDGDCNANQYCFGKNNPLQCNECRAKKPDGSWCNRDAMCVHFCHGFRCTECEQDSDCAAGEYCKNRLLPGILNKCSPKKPDGSWCIRDPQCQNYCDGARCAECESDSHCPSGEYCKNKNIPFVVNHCSSKCNKWCWNNGDCSGSACNNCKWYKKCK